VPTVTATVPASGATDVVAANALTATFSQPMNASTITTSTFTLETTSNDTVVTGTTVTYNSGTQTATLTPSAPLAYSTAYTATITTGATSSAGAALASNYSWSFTTGSAPSAATVDFGTTYQTIRGFGGSTAWLGPLTTAQATELFSPTASASSLGLSILRVRIDPEGTASGGGTYGDPFETGEWDAELTNAQEAVAANANAIVFASPWTPPDIWKLSGSSTTVDGNTFNEAFYSPSSGCSPAGDNGAYCGGYLDPNHYADYANYLEDFVTFFDANAGFNLYAISMQNEPEENVDYESCIWTPAQMDAFVASLTSGGATNPITTNLIMPEADSFQAFQAETTLEDTSAAPNVSIVGGHLYGTTPSAPPSYYSGKDIWMTEHYLNPANGSAFTIGDALAAAEEVHNSLVTGQYNAYVWWWIWNDPNDGVDYGLITSSTTTPAPTSFGYAIGQFSKFIQPDFVRVSATASPVAGVYLSAYNYTGSNSYPYHYVIVAINSTSSSENIAFTLDNGSGVTSLTPYETTSAVQLAPQTAVPVTSGQFTFALPAQSIVTFVQ
jgi:glucuronoarabinoxylan endo-1,4-beta-xylanase